MGFSTEGDRVLSRLDSCCVYSAVLVCPDCKHVIVTEKWCMSAWCPDCRRRWRVDALARAREATRGWGRCRSLVLTWRNPGHGDLRESLAAGQRAWARLRKSKLWRELGRPRGIVFWGLTESHTKGWHPHLHLIIECDWIDKDSLAVAWRECGAAEGLDAWHTRVRLVGRPEDGAEDQASERARVIDHHLKGTNQDVGTILARARRDPAILGEAAAAMRGRPWFRCFGREMARELEDGSSTMEPGVAHAPFRLPRRRKEYSRALCPGCGAAYVPWRSKHSRWICAGEIYTDERATRYPQGPRVSWAWARAPADGTMPVQAGAILPAPGVPRLVQCMLSSVS